MNDLYNYSIQPNNYIAEEILIGYIIVNPFLLKSTLQNIYTEHFFIESHKILYKHLKQINDSNIADPSNIFISLPYQKIFQNKNILSKIIELIRQVYIFNTSVNVNFYLIQLVQVINENYSKRIIIQYAYNIINLTYSNEVCTKDIILKISEYVQYINRKLSNKNLDNSQDFVINLVKNISNQNSERILLTKTLYSGFKSLDKITRGIPIGDLIIIAGRPSMGKTSLVINIAYNILSTSNTQICIFSLEMTKLQILQRIIAIGSHIPLHYILEGKIYEYQWKKIISICNQILTSNIYINDTCNITIEDIYYILKQIHNEVSIYILVIIDYLQLIQIQDPELENRNQELSYITRQLKILAQGLNTPIIILSQLNRRIETRNNKKPLLSDLKESGCISYLLCFYINSINKISISNSEYYSRYSWPYIKSSLKERTIYKYNYNSIKKFNFFIEQTFHNIICYIKYIQITENHPLLMHKYWLISNIIQQNNCASHISLISKVKNNIQKITNILITCLISNLVYDLSNNEYLNFFYTSLIIHNSIEQDADIIIMLYSNNNELTSEHFTEEKIIDINISKNRNGSTGSLKLLFHLRNTMFTDLNT